MNSTTTMGYLYRNIIVDEFKCVEYLKSKNLLSNNRLVCSKKNIDGTECGGQLRETTRSSKKRNSDGTFKKIVTMRCTKKGCQTYQSIRAGNPFFTYTDLNGKCHSNLALTEIIELVWYWVHKIPVHNVVLWTGRSKSTVIDWYNLCRDVVVDQFSKRPKMGGPGYIVQIDESLFQGKRKYNRGRLQRGDYDPRPHEDSDETSNYENETPVENNQRNYRNRIQGPWVFGLCCNNDNKTER
ncbi:uncharacterized protein LOC132945664 [Metopolophium dirhodum]|uniref:uncharacterized protein LOC132945664 n=1 Tax=Metopolophium dirhodum TaxID=44670 RepID=UPI0029905D69|nr:uncharacterized protein LOC132945664 [Metopolophium dirhodum]